MWKNIFKRAAATAEESVVAPAASLPNTFPYTERRKSPRPVRVPGAVESQDDKAWALWREAMKKESEGAAMGTVPMPLRPK